MITRIHIVLLIIFTSFEAIHAQKGTELGGWIGASHYFGDLNNLYRLNEPGLAGGIIARYNVNSRLSPQIMLNCARVRAHDSKSSNLFDRRRNLSFYSDIFEICPSLSFNFFPFVHGKSYLGASPHLITGLSIFYFNPKADYQGKSYALRNLGTEGQPKNQEYSSISAAWLVGFGIKVDLSYRWSLNVDLNTRISFTDYLDDVSGTYPNLASVQIEHGSIAVALSDPSIPGINGEKIGRQGFQRGDGKDKDMFASFGVGLLYFFGRLDCPKISNNY
ncbi:MAG: DUF6089 family protein [Saprospiraceae bacterium]